MNYFKNCFYLPIDYIVIFVFFLFENKNYEKHNTFILFPINNKKLYFFRITIQDNIIEMGQFSLRICKKPHYQYTVTAKKYNHNTLKLIPKNPCGSKLFQCISFHLYTLWHRLLVPNCIWH